MSLLNESLKVHDHRSLHLVEAAIDRAIACGLDAPGIADTDYRLVFAQQLIESIRRVQFVLRLEGSTISELRTDPTNPLFDPIRAAAFLVERNELDEACWLVFLATHFGQRPETGWSLAAAFYRGDSDGPWTWDRVMSDIDEVRRWLHENMGVLKASGRFGNHRKYESLDAFSRNGTGAAIASYAAWVGDHGSHASLFLSAYSATEHDRNLSFAYLYDSMDKVSRFGRTAKFDYICMLGKLRLANVWPASMYLDGATGPKRGGRLLLGEHALSNRTIESSISLLDDEMQVGMQVFEDALCNWQKSPDRFVRFRG